MRVSWDQLDSTWTQRLWEEMGAYKLIWRETAAQKRNIFYDDDDMMIFFIVEIWTSRASQLGTPFYQFDTRWSHYYDPFKKYV